MMGRTLKFKLLERLQQFVSVFGITLTVDGSLFRSPYEAWLYVMNTRRALSRFVNILFKQGQLISRDYFWVLEFQRETLQPHWHLLVNSSYVEFGSIVEAWSSFRPASAPKLAEKVTAENYRGQAPAFGSVRFTLQRVRAYRAAGYACKYLIKVPDYGFPDWVLDHEGNVPRYGRSQGFFPSDKRPSSPEEAGYKVHRPECWCPGCRTGQLPMRDQQRRLRTPRERVARCGQSSYIAEAEQRLDEAGNITLGRTQYVRSLQVPFDVIQQELGADEKGRVILDSVDDARVRALEHYQGQSLEVEPMESSEWE